MDNKISGPDSLLLFVSVVLVHTIWLRSHRTTIEKSVTTRVRQRVNGRSLENAATVESPGTRFHFWSNETGMVKRERGRAAYFELGSFVSGDNVFTVGLQSHRNPNENGIKLLFYKGDLPQRSKVGYLIMRNSTKEQSNSALVGLFIDPLERKSGFSAPFLAIWLSLCLEAHIVPKTSIMNKPLLCLVLQHTFDFQPACKGGTKVGISRAQGGKIGMYPVPGGAQSVETVYSKRSLRREGIVVLEDAPEGGIGREIVVQCYLQASDEDPRLEKLTSVVARVIKGPDGNGSFQHVIASPCTLKGVLLGVHTE